jgi:esterase/lipase superfamily enzyme
MKKLTRRTLLVQSAAFLARGESGAACEFFITGPNGPVRYGLFSIVDARLSEKIYGRTDQAGRLEIRLDPGKYRLRVDADGYQSKEFELTIKDKAYEVSRTFKLDAFIPPQKGIDRHVCKGQNSCRGKGGCATDANSCRAKNMCRGKGGCATLTPGGHYTLKLFFGTDRQYSRTSTPSDLFGNQRSNGEISLGTCTVTIPATHRRGDLEVPAWWVFTGRSDPSRYFQLESLQRLQVDAFRRTIGESLKGLTNRDVLIFVHGFNTSFSDAALRTAQLAFDLNFDGIPAFYSWPSEGRLKSYLADQENVEWCVGHLTDFLAAVAAQPSVNKVHLIAHSMGSRAVARALTQPSLVSSSRRPRFRELVFAAPDIDADLFRQFAPHFKSGAERVTIYASSEDSALKAAERLNHHERAGQTVPHVVTIDGIDTN